MKGVSSTRAKLLLTKLENLCLAILKFCGKALLVTGLLGGIVWVGWWLLPDDSTTKYTFQYDVAKNHVTIDPKPHNCDWDSAPLGSKHCHYEKLVMVLNSENQVVGGTGVAIGTSTTGKPIISFDGGKTWQINPAGNNLGARSVYVAWRKVED